VRFSEPRRLVLLQRLSRLRQRLQRRALIHLVRLVIHVLQLLKHLLLRNLAWLLRRRQDLELLHLRRVQEFHFGLPHPASRALLLHNVLPLLRHLEVLRRLQEQVREQVRERRAPQAVLLRKARDFQLVPVDHLLVDSRVPAHLKVFDLQAHLAKRVPAGRGLACHCAPEADLQEDILSAPAAPANVVAGPIKDLSADNVPAQPAEQEFRKLNPASRFMRASRPRREAVRSSRSAMRKVNANSILCAPARVRAQDGRRKRSLWRQYSASHGK
jgi:hypothetical protein